MVRLGKHRGNPCGNEGRRAALTPAWARGTPGPGFCPADRLLAPAFLAQEIPRGIQDPFLTVFGSRRMTGLLALQIDQIRLAVGAFDHFDMKLDIRGQLRLQRVQEIAAKMLAARAREPRPEPDRS